MDDSEWTATGLFSPSKARLAQAQARDWGYVDAWLSKKYSSGQMPSFERNEDTLQTLLALSSSVDAADEQRSAIERVEKTALQYLSKHNSESGHLLLKNINEHFSDQTRADLDSLAGSAIALDVPASAGAARLTAAATNLQIEAFEAKQSKHMAQGELDLLQAEIERLTVLHQSLQSDTYRPSSERSNQTAEWSKGTKLLRAKIVEYEERTAAIQPASAMVRLMEEVQRVEQQMVAQQQRLADTNEKIRTYQT